MSQYEVPDWKLRVAYNGIDCSRFNGRIDPVPCRQEYDVGPRDPIVLFMGRLSTQKGPDRLLDAVPGILQQHPDAKVVLVGDGDMRPYLDHRANEAGISHAVRFLGALPPNGRIVNLCKSADVVCLPSRNEPFGIVVLEAWAAGRPVIAGPLAFRDELRNELTHAPVAPLEDGGVVVVSDVRVAHHILQVADDQA